MSYRCNIRLLACLLIASSGLISAQAQETPSASDNTPVVASEPKLQKSEIDGTWKLTAYFVNGKENKEVTKSNYTVTRANGLQTITINNKDFSQSKFEVDSSKKPKQVDFIQVKDDPQPKGLGIYQLNENELKIALFIDAEKQKTTRPTSFDQPECLVAVYQRVDQEKPQAAEEPATPN